MKLQTMLFILLITAFLSGCGNVEEKGSNSASQNSDNHTSEEMSEETDAENDFPAQVEMIANDEKIIEMLKESGEIPKDASGTEIQEALEEYLKKKAKSADDQSSEKYIEDLKKQIQKDLHRENN